MATIAADIGELLDTVRRLSDELSQSSSVRMDTALSLGQALLEAKRSVGHGNWTMFLGAAQISQQWAHRLMTLACNEESVRANHHSGGDFSVNDAYAEVRQMQKSSRQESVAEAIATQDGCTLSDLQTQIAKGAKYGCIYADPPWAYGNQSTRAATGNHYVTMSVQDICDLPIKELAADQAHLHLWTTNAFLRDSYTLMEAWGFDYRSILVWCKGDDEASPQIGIGNYWRVNTEYLLLGIRGGLQFAKTEAAKKAQLSSWIHHKRMGHSRKPPVFRELIEAVSPGPRLELFGRMAVPGWDVWGNEVERTLFAGANRG